MLPFIFISPIYAEDPEHGEVIIQTDGTYSDHEVIEACEVGSMVKLDIGSFDTAYINNNFEYNANIDGLIYFECGSYNDIKLAYYGTNQTIFVSYEDLLTDAQLNALSTFDFNVDNMLIATWKDYNYISLDNNFSDYDASTGQYNFNGFYTINNEGGVYYNNSSGSTTINGDNRYVFYFKYNGEVLYNGLPEQITDPILFEDVASIYINPIFDSYSQSISSIDAPTYSITLSNYNMTLNGQLKCDYFYSDTDLCAYYSFENKLEDSDGNSVTYPYATIDLPNIFMTNTNNASQLSVDGYYHYTFHYDVLITFDDEYEGYLEFQNTGKFYVNGSELRFTKTTTYRSDSPDFYYNLVLTDYSLKRKIDPIVDGTEESQGSEQANNAMNENLNNTVSNFESVEQSYNESIDSGLNSIDFEAVNFGDSFLQSSSFVVSAFDAIVMSTPLGDYLTIVLIIGLFLLIVGRYL